MSKAIHEIRDPIHVFIHLNSYEKLVLDSRPFQRLRNITQLAMTYLLYPGATHKRFEHSLGVMELAGRVFDVVTKRANLTDDIRDLLHDLENEAALGYWRQVLRMAALCHDIGHLPFSHAAEEELLPAGWTHERLSRMLIESEEMRAIWKKMVPPLDPEHIVKLAVGKRKATDLQFSKWETILSEIIVGDAFGVDRIDYLLRDSHHTGVAYGKFDHYRLIDELRILPSVEGPSEPALGVNAGGIYSAEALALARYFMFSQVYYHPIRMVYDHHLKDFLSAWLADGTLFKEGAFPIDIDGHLQMTDDEVNAAIRAAALDQSAPGHRPASCIMRHRHFKLLYERNPQDAKVHSSPGEAIAKAARAKFGEEAVRYSKPKVKSPGLDFPVRERDNRIQAGISASQTLSKLQPTSMEYVFIDPQVREQASEWLQSNRDAILHAAQEKEREDDHEAEPKSRTAHSAES